MSEFHLTRKCVLKVADRKSENHNLHNMRKGGYYDHFWIHRSKWSFWYQMKAPIFLITPVKFYVEQMLFVKV